MVAQQRLFQSHGRCHVLPLRPDHGKFSLGDSHLGAGDIFVVLRLFRTLNGCDVVPRQFDLTTIGGLALCQNGLHADGCRFCLGLIGDIGRHGGAGAGQAGLLFGLVQRAEFLPLCNPTPCIGRQRQEGRTPLEPNADKHPRLDRAKAVDAQGNIGFRLDDRHQQRAHGQEQRPRTPCYDRRCRINPAFRPRSDPLFHKQAQLHIQQAQSFWPQVKVARPE